jgi:hypothetical protein
MYSGNRIKRKKDEKERKKERKTKKNEWGDGVLFSNCKFYDD